MPNAPARPDADAPRSRQFSDPDVDDPARFEAGRNIALPTTRRGNTGKGYHLYFEWDPTAPVINAQRSAKGWGIRGLPGADVRGQGGYVIVPPSIHPRSPLRTAQA